MQRPPPQPDLPPLLGSICQPATAATAAQIRIFRAGKKDPESAPKYAGELLYNANEVRAGARRLVKHRAGQTPGWSNTGLVKHRTS